MLIDGQWDPDAALTTNEDGEFVRDTSSFDGQVTPDGPHPVESDRYRLYVSYACPWAHRTLITRALLGLEAAIPVDVVDPHRLDQGWEFSPDKPGCTPDRATGADYLRELYQASDPDYTGRVTVPTLYDEHEETIVNNRSKEIMRQFDTVFQPIADRDLTLYPEDMADEIDRYIDDLYDSVNNAVYEAGFATTQSAYEDGVNKLFAGLDRWDDHLAENRYVAGDRLTEADICLFTTLVRFDSVYHTHFKCNRRQIRDYNHLHGFCKEIYQLPGVADTVDMDHITNHYYKSHTNLNPRGIVPVGPENTLAESHDRDRLGGGPPDPLA